MAEQKETGVRPLSPLTELQKKQLKGTETLLFQLFFIEYFFVVLRQILWYDKVNFLAGRRIHIYDNGRVEKALPQ